MEIFISHSDLVIFVYLGQVQKQTYVEYKGPSIMHIKPEEVGTGKMVVM